MTINIREARDGDAGQMAPILNEIIAIGGLTAHTTPFDEKRIRREFIHPTRHISCFVALEGAQLRGFQALEWSDPEWPGEDRLPADWAFISTFVQPGHHRRGIGRALFEKTVAAAEAAGVIFIDATIRLENTRANAYYSSLGFEEYRRSAHAVSKRFAPRRG
ncbi:GNAT family N-acetyltransferase [Chelativorans sp. SCAU2101]|mgnify:FL=1|uniref:GNAT family N-acetyltransferase n=1 Tax=Chelativorans petroleitrophicus TaxID=2975484 RepID=A0A9X2XCG7_9HYPH|nr:GNAT family N-acetyltransferase [Chelativorans petroleitrophicus]MCT8992309.1 GNAT family N-acetyltransferase [Chelativorans petroleitrophicus]